MKKEMIPREFSDKITEEFNVCWRPRKWLREYMAENGYKTNLDFIHSIVGTQHPSVAPRKRTGLMEFSEIRAELLRMDPDQKALDWLIESTPNRQIGEKRAEAAKNRGEQYASTKDEDIPRKAWTLYRITLECLRDYYDHKN